MGSDLYMEAQAFKPRPNKAEWEGDELLIYRDTFYHGWSLTWRGNPKGNDESLLKALIGGPVPPKPEPKPVLLDDIKLIMKQPNLTKDRMAAAKRIEKFIKEYEEK